MSEPTPMVVKLSDVADIVAAVPHMLGFEPRESLVGIALCGPRQRMSFSLRIDLPEDNDVDGTFDGLADYVGAVLQRAEAESALLCIFSGREPGDRGMPWQQLVDDIEQAMSVRLRDAVLVGAERIWSYLCVDPDCCPSEGRWRDARSPGATTLAAAHAMLGNVVLPSRDDLVATVAPVGGPAAVSMDQAIERAALRHVDAAAAPSYDDDRAVIDALVERYARPPASLTHDEAAAVVVALHDIVLRDEVIGWFRQRPEAMRALLTDLVRLAQPPMDAPACSLFAIAAYLDGDGVVARTAIDRARSSDPHYSLAQLLEEAITGLVPPKVFREALRAFDRERVNGDATRTRRRGTASPDAAGRRGISRSPGGAAPPDTRRRGRGGAGRRS